jgi:N6-adenosine-specific RNA methylase IME4
LFFIIHVNEYTFIDFYFGEIKCFVKFSVFLADPSWQYDHSYSENRVIENQCPTMTLEEIIALPVKDICTRSAVLYLWVTSPKLQEGLYVMGEWGFTYRSSMVWVKDQYEMGYWAISKHKYLLIGTKGKMPCPDPKLRPESVISAKRCKHSEKPDDVYRIIEKAYPTLKKI